MISLKAFSPVLAEALGTTPAAIYERQRALVRLGLLPAPTGRGRGNGLPASAGTVAMLIIAMMVTDNLSDTDDRVRWAAEAELLGTRRRKGPKPRCALTGKRDFKSALVTLLRMTEFPVLVDVEVSRSDLHSTINWVGGTKGRGGSSQFGEKDWTASYLTVRSCLKNGALQSIASALRQADGHDAVADGATSGEML